MADPKKYISKIVKGSDTLWLKDAEARQDIEDIKSSITGGMHYLGKSTTPIEDGEAQGPWVIDGVTYIASGTPTSGQKLLAAGDIAIYGELEFIWSGASGKWQEFGSTGSLGALAFKDSASGNYTPAGTNTASEVTFTGQTSASFVSGFNDDAVAPTFTEGIFTPAAFQNGFATAGSAASFTEGAFNAGSLPSLGAAVTGNFNTDAEKSTYDGDSETLTISAATTASAVTAQGTFNAGSLPSKEADEFIANVPTAIDTTKFSGGSKAADQFSAGSAATPTTATAVTAVGTAEAAAQVFSGTQATITVE